jgi:uncharacterized protein
MLMVRTRIGPSSISGIGLFANEHIPKGSLVWRFQPGLDLLFTEGEVATLSEPARRQFENYAFLDRKYGKFMLCGDDARFFNHSRTPNCDDSVSDSTFALRDIFPGEELTVNYADFYGNLEEQPFALERSKSFLIRK